MPATGHPAAQLLRQPQLPEHVLVGFDARLPLLLVLAKPSGIVCLRRRLYKHQPFPVEEISKEGNLHITWLRRPIFKIFVITVEEMQKRGVTYAQAEQYIKVDKYDFYLTMATI